MNESSQTVAADRAEALAIALLTAIETNDVEAIRNDIYAADVVVWHNNDEVEQKLEDNLKVLRWMGRNVSSLRYEEIRRQITPTGFVQQHVLRGTGSTGRELNIPACLVVTIADDRITRIDEYLDGAGVARFAG